MMIVLPDRDIREQLEDISQFCKVTGYQVEVVLIEQEDDVKNFEDTGKIDGFWRTVIENLMTIPVSQASIEFDCLQFQRIRPPDQMSQISVLADFVATEDAQRPVGQIPGLYCG